MEPLETIVDPKQANPILLAYVGDAVQEVYVRMHVINQGVAKPNELHKASTAYVSAYAQAKAAHDFIEQDVLTAEEAAVLRRGRNAKSTVPKSADPATYRYSTGFEALIGYLYLMDRQERLRTLIAQALKMADEGKEGGSERE
ncbi:Mini-ribonuclease 3 [Salsuginibacillus halophilus]|nr:ribonuclease III domain-containing protein [Salsuginibacillus halophilus]